MADAVRPNLPPVWSAGSAGIAFVDELDAVLDYLFDVAEAHAGHPDVAQWVDDSLDALESVVVAEFTAGADVPPDERETLERDARTALRLHVLMYTLSKSHGPTTMMVVETGEEADPDSLVMTPDELSDRLTAMVRERGAGNG